MSNSFIFLFVSSVFGSLFILLFISISIYFFICLFPVLILCLLWFWCMWGWKDWGIHCLVSLIFLFVTLLMPAFGFNSWQLINILFHLYIPFGSLSLECWTAPMTINLHVHLSSKFLSMWIKTFLDLSLSKTQSGGHCVFQTEDPKYNLNVKYVGYIHIRICE